MAPNKPLLVLAASIAILPGTVFAQTPVRTAAPPPAIAETPTFQGHDAESKMRDPEDDARHRALFFDGVDVEIGPPGLPCDHVVTRKPESVAGRGQVVTFAVRDGAAPMAPAHAAGTPAAKPSRAKTIRVWLPPPATASLDEAIAAARAAALARLPGALLAQTGAREFWWCK
jgi:hypothetical protein